MNDEEIKQFGFDGVQLNFDSKKIPQHQSSLPNNGHPLIGIQGSISDTHLVGVGETNKLLPNSVVKDSEDSDLVVPTLYSDEGGKNILQNLNDINLSVPSVTDDDFHQVEVPRQGLISRFRK